MARLLEASLASVALVALVLAGCSGDGDDRSEAASSAAEAASGDDGGPAGGDDGGPAGGDDAPAPGNEEPGDAPEAPDDPFAIPDEIDEPYVQAVLDELYRSRTQALKVMLGAAGDGEISVPTDALELVRESHDGPRLTHTVDNLGRIMRATNLDELFRPLDEMGDEAFHLLDVLHIEESCIVVTGRHDTSETVSRPSGEMTYAVVALSRASKPDDGATPWRLFDESRLHQDEAGTAASKVQVEELSFSEVRGFVELPCAEAGQ